MFLLLVMLMYVSLLVNMWTSTVLTGSGQLKVGSFQRSERMVKWNECLRIQDEIGASAFVGGAP